MWENGQKLSALACEMENEGPGPHSSKYPWQPFWSPNPIFPLCSAYQWTSIRFKRFYLYKSENMKDAK